MFSSHPDYCHLFIAAFLLLWRAFQPVPLAKEVGLRMHIVPPSLQAEASARACTQHSSPLCPLGGVHLILALSWARNGVVPSGPYGELGELALTNLWLPKDSRRSNFCAINKVHMQRTVSRLSMSLVVKYEAYRRVTYTPKKKNNLFLVPWSNFEARSPQVFLIVAPNPILVSVVYDALTPPSTLIKD